MENAASDDAYNDAVNISNNESQAVENWLNDKSA